MKQKTEFFQGWSINEKDGGIYSIERQSNGERFERCTDQEWWDCRLPVVAEEVIKAHPRQENRATSTMANPGGAANRRQLSSLAVCDVSVSAKTSNDRSVRVKSIQSVFFCDDCVSSHPIVIDCDRKAVLLSWLIKTGLMITCCALSQKPVDVGNRSPQLKCKQPLLYDGLWRDQAVERRRSLAEANVDCTVEWSNAATVQQVTTITTTTTM